MRCSNNLQPVSYFETPEFIITTSHLISLIATPTYILGFYCILFKSSKKAKSLKWCMLISMIWCVLQDICMAILTVPILLFPEFAGYPFGILTQYFGISPYFQVYIGVLCIIEVGTSAVCFLENRYHHIRNVTISQKKIHILFYCLNSSVTILLVYFAMEPFPEQTSARSIVFESLPCLPQYVYNIEIFVVTLDKEKAAAHVSLIVLLIFSQFFFYFFATYYYLFMISSSIMSRTTRQYQRTVFISVSVQCAIPIASYLMPLSYIIFSSTFIYHNQVFNNILVLLFSTHGILSVVAMLFLQKSYREFILRKEQKPLSQRYLVD